MCKIFKISRSGYYAFVKRIGRPGRDVEKYEMIKQCQEENKGRYGYRRVVLWFFNEKGVVINHKAAIRIMKKYGLQSRIRRRRFKNYQKSEDLKHPNILDRNFEVSLPNKKWVTDITYIKVGSRAIYLSAIKDLFDDSIIAFSISSRQRFDLIRDTLLQTKEKVTDGLILHSDQGCQYTSTAYNNLLREYHITASMSRPGNPYDNSPAENFFSTLKCECIYLDKPKTVEDAVLLIHEYIYYYNNKRIQLKTGTTPMAKRELALTEVKQ